MNRRLAIPLACAALVLLAVAAPGSAGASGGTEPSCEGRRATIVGTPNSETIVGTPGPDVIVALGGDDVVRAGGGDDVVCAGRGNDRVLGEAGADQLFGVGGRDILDGGAGGQAVLWGGSGDDTIRGGDGADGIYAGAGSDLVIAGGGDDYAHGGKGADVVRDGAGDDHTYEEGVGNVVRLGPGDDDEQGLAVRSEVYGGKGADHISTRANVVDGGPGDDELESSFPASFGVDAELNVAGGGGDDQLSLFNMWSVAADVDIDGGPGSDFVNFYPEEDPGPGVYAFSMGPDGSWSSPYTGGFADVESFYSDKGVYQITGSDGPDWIRVPHEMNNGDDVRLWGLGGDDFLDGPMLPGSIDGGDGVDACSEYEVQLNCEGGT
jgi:Ca2+-binding RTX toxin-like protein